MSFQVHVNTILWGGSVKTGCPTRPTKGQSTDRNASAQKQKELQVFLGIINYLNKFSPGTLEVCKPFRKLMSSKMTWTWNVSCQQLFYKANPLIKVEMCMKFYDVTKPLHLETDASGIGLGAALLQLRDNTGCQKDSTPDNTNLHPIAFISKGLTVAE